MLPLYTNAAIVILFGLLYRQRGGGIELPIGTQGARAIWAVPVGILVGLIAFRHGASYWSILAGLVSLAGAFVGLLIAHARNQDMGRCGDSLGADVAGMGWVMADRALLLSLPLAPWCPWAPVTAYLAGRLCGPAYAIGWEIPSSIPHLRQGTEIGELLSGSLMIAGLLIGAAL